MQPTTQYAPCPKCGSTNAEKMKFTWWGGTLGPNLFTHVKCRNCNTEYNGKTGKSNQQNILIYFAVAFLLACCACGAFGAISYFLNNS